MFSPPSILIVEDEAIVAADLASKVQQMGYAVAGTLATGEEAVAATRARRPALVLMDVHLAGAMDGIAAARAIHAASDLPVVFLTADHEATSVAGAGAAGAFGYLRKPFDERDLQIQIEMALSRHAAARRLRENEERLAGIVNSAMDAIISVDEAQTIQLFNAAAEAMFGIPAGEALGQPLERLIPERFRSTHAEHIRSFGQLGATARRMGQLGEVSGRRADGTEFPIEASISQVRTDQGNVYTVVLRDITVRKQALAGLRASRLAALNLMEDAVAAHQEVERSSAALRVSEARFRALIENAADAVLLLDARGRAIFQSDNAQRMLGYTGGSLTARSSFALLHPEDVREARRLFREVHAQPETLFQAEFRVRHRDGSWRWVDITGKNLLANPAVQGIVLNFRDVTQRRAIEEALREGEARFRHMADSAPVLIWMAGPDKGCTWFNKPWLEFTGRTLSQQLGNGWTEGVHPDDAARCWQHYAAAFDAREEFRMDYRLRRHDGEWRWIFDHGRPLYHGATFIGYIGSCVDVTVRKEAEAAQLRMNAELERRVTERTEALQTTLTARKRAERLSKVQQKRLRQLASKVATAQDAEQRRIGEGLHDDVAQVIAACSVKLALLRVGTQQAARDKLFNEIDLLLREADEKIHSLSFELGASTLHQSGLEHALRELCDRMAARYGVQFALLRQGSAHPLPQGTATVLFKAARELLFNVVKHAAVQQASIELHWRRDETSIVVIDHGKGFRRLDPNSLSNSSKGLGLFAVRERLHDLGGDLRIETAREGKTRVVVRVPRAKAKG